MNTALIGDSKYMIFRGDGANNYTIVHESKTHQHSFNFPYQIGTNGDDPNCAIEEKVKI